MDLPGVLESRKKSGQVRVMGMVLSMANLASHPTNETDAFYDDPIPEEWKILELEDGTGIVQCNVPMAMVERMVNLKVGNHVDVIGQVQPQDDGNGLLLKADTLLEIPKTCDPTAAERLRWMEITHRDKISWCGYPCPDVTPQDLFDIIESNPPGEGVTIADLALVLDYDAASLRPLIEDLQWQGLIYEDKKGSYVPL